MARRKHNLDALASQEMWSKGLGTTTSQQPISVKFPPEIDRLLRAMDDRSTYIRVAVEAKLRQDRLFSDTPHPKN